PLNSLPTRRSSDLGPAEMWASFSGHPIALADLGCAIVHAWKHLSRIAGNHHVQNRGSSSFRQRGFQGSPKGPRLLDTDALAAKCLGNLRIVGLGEVARLIGPFAVHQVLQGLHVAGGSVVDDDDGHGEAEPAGGFRSEERRVGKERGGRWWA